MLAKLIVNFFSLNAPVFALLAIATVYLVLAVKLKRALNWRDFNLQALQSRISWIDPNRLEKLLRSQLFEKTSIVLNSVLIGFHLLLLLLVSLLFVSNLGSHGSSFLSLTANVSVLNSFSFSGNYQALISSKKQTDELKRSYCKANQLSSICEINDQINQQISSKLENLHQKLAKKDLKNVRSAPKEETNFIDESKKNYDLNEIEQCSNQNSDHKAGDKTDWLHNVYLTELDKLSGQIGAAFLGIIAIFLSLTHFSDTLLSSALEFKINKIIRNPNITYRELNWTHIVERVLTPFAIYFDFKHPTNPAYLGWFTISWSLLNIVSRSGYLRRLNNGRRFQTILLLDDLQRTKVVFYSLLLLLFSYQMSLPSAGRSQNLAKIFQLFYSLLMFLISLSDYEMVLKQENRPINLDLNNNQIGSPNGRSKPMGFNNFASYSTGSLMQPVCNLSRRF